jgi:hypothetical protein
MPAWITATAAASNGAHRSMPSTSAANSLPIGMNRMGISMVFAHYNAFASSGSA